MKGLRRATAADQPRDAHAHARMLAAASLDEALTSAECASLATHLDACRECRQAALDYAFQGERVHGLHAIQPPRDLAAALAARLDVEEAHRADERARRADRRRISWQAHPVARRLPAMLVPAGAGAPFRRPTPVATTVGAGAALSLVAAVALIVAGVPGILTRPAATPFAIEASSVSWVTRDADGRFLVQTASVDQACPGASYACEGFGAQPTTLVALDVEPASVFIARGGRDAIVIDVGAGGMGPDGGSVYAIQLPTPLPATTAGDSSMTVPTAIVADPGASAETGTGAAGAGAVGATGTPGPGTAVTGPAAVALLSPAPAQSSQATPTAVAVVAGLATATAAAGRTVPGRRWPVASPSAPTIVVGPAASLPSTLPLPTAAATRAIAWDVVLVGGRAAYSPDGRWFAFSARPADASTGPDVYVWRVGDETTRAITTDHAAVFAGWVGDRLLVSAPDEAARDAVARTAANAAASTAPASPKPSAKPSAKPKSTPAATARPATSAATAKPAASAAPGSSENPAASAAPAASPSPGGPPPTVPFSYLVDPSTRARTLLETRGLWMPSVDPTGHRVVGWLGTVRADPASRSWRPADGALVVESWPTILGGPDSETAAASAGATAAPERTKPPKAAASPRPTGTVQADATEPPAAEPPSPTPASDVRTATPEPKTARGAASAARTPNKASPSPTASPTATAVVTGPVTLRIAGLTAIPATWQVGWDQEGTHLAVWIADTGSQEIGKLSLVSLDAENAASPKALLSGTPALSAFAMGRGRIAWATPPDETGSGGQVRMLVWSGSSVGEMFTGPILGLETLVGAD